MLLLGGCTAVGLPSLKPTTGSVLPVVPPPTYGTYRAPVISDVFPDYPVDFEVAAPVAYDVAAPAYDPIMVIGEDRDLVLAPDAPPPAYFAPMSLPADEIVVSDVSGVSFSGLSTCAAAAVVFADSLGAPYECVGDTGSLSVYVPQPDASVIYAAFEGAVTAAGGTVAMRDGVIHVQGGEGEGGGFAGSPPSGLSSVAPAPGVQAFSTSDAAILETMQGIAVLQSPGVAFLEAPSGVSAADLHAIAATSPIEFQVIETEGRIFYVASSRDAPLVEPIVRGLSRTAVPVSAVPPSDASLVAMRYAFPELTIEADPDANVLWLAGSPVGIGDFMRDYRQFLVSPADYRVDAAFLSWRDGASASHNVTPSVDLGAQTGVGMVRVLAGGSLGGLGLMLDRVTASGQASLISKPSIAVRAGQPGRFVSGQSVPVRTQIGDGDELRDVIEYRETGVVVQVTPRPMLNGLVRLDLDLQISAVAGGSGVGSNPIFDTQNVQTSVEVQPGDVVVLSGLALTTREASDGSVLYGPNGSEQRRDESLQVVIALSQEGGAGSRMVAVK